MRNRGAEMNAKPISLKPKFSTKANLVIGLALVFLRGLMMVPTNSRLVLSVCLHSKFPSKAFYVVWNNFQTDIFVQMVAGQISNLFGTRASQPSQYDPNQQPIYLVCRFARRIFHQNPSRSLSGTHVFPLFPCDPNSSHSASFSITLPMPWFPLLYIPYPLDQSGRQTCLQTLRNSLFARHVFQPFPCGPNWQHSIKSQKHVFLHEN